MNSVKPAGGDPERPEVPGYMIQMFCIAVAVLTDDDPDPILPRWAGYLNLWVWFSGVGGGFAAFFKDGAFAWNGVIGFWIPVMIFAGWLVVMTALLHTGLKRKPLAEQANAKGTGTTSCHHELTTLPERRPAASRPG